MAALEAERYLAELYEADDEPVASKPGDTSRVEPAAQETVHTNGKTNGSTNGAVPEYKQNPLI